MLAESTNTEPMCIAGWLHIVTSPAFKGSVAILWPGSGLVTWFKFLYLIPLLPFSQPRNLPHTSLCSLSSVPELTWYLPLESWLSVSVPCTDIYSTWLGGKLTITSWGSMAGWGVRGKGHVLTTQNGAATRRPWKNKWAFTGNRQKAWKLVKITECSPLLLTASRP